MKTIRNVWISVAMLSISLNTFAGPQAAVPLQSADEWSSRPVDDRTYKAYLDFFTYDPKIPLDIRVTTVISFRPKSTRPQCSNGCVRR